MTTSVSTVERLKSSGIAPVYVIDDAFDLPHIGDDPEQFWLEARKDKEVEQELQSIHAVAEAEDIDEAMIQAIWMLRERSPKLKALADKHLFVSRLQQLTDLGLILQHLTDIGLAPRPCGVGDEIPANARLVFLDYVLNPRNTLDLAKVAVERAEQLYDSAPSDGKPFIVLMSDHPDAVKQHRDFREQSKLMGGLFAFIKKSEARTREQLLFRLGTWGIADDNFVHLQEFVVAVLKALDAAKDKFRKRVYALDVHDYSFIQKECLYKDGQPLGEYLMWLFEASLGFSLRDNDDVIKTQSKLDGMRFDKLLPCDRTPSDHLAEFYLSAVTEPAVEKLARHPFAGSENVPLLYLGDIFLHKDSKLAVLVLSAACDLAYRPIEKDPLKRSDPEQPVYLCPGILKQLGAGHKREGELWTELISLNNKPYRIEWDHKHVFTRKLSEIQAYFDQSEYHRRWRLRMPYALEVQQAFVAHVSRVGLPVPPAFVQQVDVEIYAPLGEGGLGELLGAKISGGLAVAEHKGQGTCVMTPDCVIGMIQRLDMIADRILDQAAALPPGSKNRADKVTKAQRRAQTIRELKARTESWAALVEEPFPLPKVGEKFPLPVENKSLVWAFRGVDVTKFKFGNAPTFAISIHFGAEMVSPAASADPAATSPPLQDVADDLEDQSRVVVIAAITEGEVTPSHQANVGGIGADTQATEAADQATERLLPETIESMRTSNEGQEAAQGTRSEADSDHELKEQDPDPQV